MPVFEVEFEVFCGECGKGLCNQAATGTNTRNGMLKVMVQPCEDCLKSAKSDAYQAGVDSVEKSE